MFERFTRSARDVVVLAQLEARALRHNYIGTEHLLLGVLVQGQGVGAQVLRGLGMRAETAREGIVDIVGAGPHAEPDPLALDAIGIDLDAVRRRAEEAFGPGALERARAARTGQRLARGRRSRRRRSCGDGRVPFTPRAKKVLELSLREALKLGHDYIGTEHILLGLLREGQGVAAQLLTKAGVDHSELRARVLEELAAGPHSG